MAKEEKKTEAVGKAEKKEPGFFKKLGTRISRTMREMKSELKKVIWPTKKQTINNALVAGAVIVAAAIVLWGFDQIAYLCVQALISLGA